MGYTNNLIPERNFSLLGWATKSNLLTKEAILSPGVGPKTPGDNALEMVNMLTGRRYSPEVGCICNILLEEALMLLCGV